jgi:gamma-glutamyl-gamma-aminobutyrate hydrolase PuuD
MKIFDLGLTAGGALHTIFESWKPEVQEFDPNKSIAAQLQGVDLLLFSGGTDVDPNLYQHRNVASSPPDKVRDARETLFYKVARQMSIPMVGVCRGSQFLCVMNGGWLVQDVDNHANGENHDVFLHDGSIINTNSTHHQLSIPPAERDVVVLGGTKNRITRWRYDTTWKAHFRIAEVEPEIIYYQRAKCLGFQFHPEYYPTGHPVPKLVCKYVNDYLLRPF